MTDGYEKVKLTVFLSYCIRGLIGSEQGIVELKEHIRRPKSPFMHHRTPLYDEKVPEVPDSITEPAMISQATPEKNWLSWGRFQWLKAIRESAVSPGLCTEAHDLSMHVLSMSKQQIAESVLCNHWPNNTSYWPKDSNKAN